MAEVEELCDELTVINHGHVVYAGGVEELRRRAPAALHVLHSSDDQAAHALGARVGTASEVRPSGCRRGRSRAGRRRRRVGRIRDCARPGRDRDSLARAPHPLSRIAVHRAHEWPRAHGARAIRRRGPSRRCAVAEARMSVRGVFAVMGVECSKLLAQFKAHALLAICVIAPFAFAISMRVQSSLPTDTLFGRAANESGFAVSLVVLGFAGLWAFPVLTGVVGGDVFSSEDRYGTWATVLTRSRSRAEIFAGKTLTAMAFSLLAIALLGASSIAAGVLVIGYTPIVDLSGILLQPEQALPRVALAWTSVVPPAIGFTALGILLVGRDAEQCRRHRTSCGHRSADAVGGVRRRPGSGASPAHHACVRRLARSLVRAALSRTVDPGHRHKRRLLHRVPDACLRSAAASRDWTVDMCCGGAKRWMMRTVLLIAAALAVSDCGSYSPITASRHRKGHRVDLFQPRRDTGVVAGASAHDGERGWRPLHVASSCPLAVQAPASGCAPSSGWGRKGSRCATPTICSSRLMAATWPRSPARVWAAPF